MTVFAGAIDAIFADANFGRDATYHVAGGMPPQGYPTRWRYLQTLVRLNGRWLIAGDAVIGPPPPPK